MTVVNFFENRRCKRIRSCLDSYLNNELMVETNHEVLTHIERCGACSQSLEDRARIKAQLKRAVMQEYAPAALREHITDDLRRRRGFSFNRVSLVVAAAVAVVIAAVTFFSWGPPKSQLSFQAEVAPGDETGQILKIGFDDHVLCTIDHQLANKQVTSEQMPEIGPEYPGLVTSVREEIPQGYTVVVGHRCNITGASLLAMRNQSDVVSLVINSKERRGIPDEPRCGDSASGRRPDLPGSVG